MNKSILDSSHHFYILCFQSDQIKKVNDILGLISDNKVSEIIAQDEKKSFVHLQVEIGKAFGSESLLQANFTYAKDNQNYYWYDFYIGSEIIEGEQFFFICYLYSKIGKYLDNCFEKSNIRKTVYKSNISSLLDYINKRVETGYEVEERVGLLASITKYSAEVKEEASTPNKVNIIGANPLQSKVYSILSNEKELTIVPISLKLKCEIVEGSSLLLSIDRLGNFRFWLYKNGQKDVIPLIPLILSFFSAINSLEESSFVNTHTLLEDEI